MKKTFNLDDYNLNLEIDKSQYITSNVNVYIGRREIKEFRSSALLYLPTKGVKQPHIYILIDNYKIMDSLTKLQKYKLDIVSDIR